jgi:hypothetical protein
MRAMSAFQRKAKVSSTPFTASRRRGTFSAMGFGLHREV